MDLVLELLDDPAYRHVLLNHLPITGLGIAWLVLAWALVERRWSSLCGALILVLWMSGSAQWVMSAGDDAYPFVYEALDGVGRDWLDHHTHLADRWGRVLIANAILAALALAAGVFRERLRTPAAVVVLVSTLAGLVAVFIIAEAGGKIRHPEFRLSDPPVHDSPGRIR
jgi:hypothetical protein